jgi:Protein of unknown function (DUF3306)
VSESDDAPDGFLSRWARRKALVREGGTAPESHPAPRPDPPPSAGAVRAQATIPSVAPPTGGEAGREAVVEGPVAEAPPPPTLDDVALLTKDSDFSRFVAPNVTPEVKNAALKKLFADPQFNVMDGLDTYIDDYGKPDPIPPAMLRQMLQSRFLGLFDDEAKDAREKVAGATPDGAALGADAQSDPELPLPSPDDQDAALRLQPLDAAGPTGDRGGAGEDAGRKR